MSYRVAVFSAQDYDIEYFSAQASDRLQFQFFPFALNADSVSIANGFAAVCCFVNDDLSAPVLQTLASFGIELIALRCAGFNNVDIHSAKALDIKVRRVPAYSPEAVAEHAVALMLTLSRKTHKAYNRTKEGNFALSGLMGFNFHQKTIGIIGLGHIGQAFAKIMHGFGCKLLGVDVNTITLPFVEQVDLATLFAQADVISLHCPLTSSTHHLINDAAIVAMKPSVMLINTSRGAIIDSQALVKHLKTGHIGYLGLDVYEQESELFFKDHSRDVIQDDIFGRLLTFPNVLITGHQGFFTHEAMSEIVNVTIHNLLAALSAATTNDVI